MAEQVTSEPSDAGSGNCKLRSSVFYRDVSAVHWLGPNSASFVMTYRSTVS